MTCVVLKLSKPPSLNRYYRVPKALGRPLISKQGREYRKAIEAELWEQAPNVTLKGDLFFRATYYPPDRRRFDLDNLLKALWDALQHAGLYKDDSQFIRIDMQKSRQKRKGGEIEVEISEVPL